MRFILLGAPGCGKGTQAKLLSKSLCIPHISTGDLFRENIKNKTELGIKVEEIISKGNLVPDDLTIELVKDRLNNPDTKNGFILDGFPRTIYQANALDKIGIDYAILIDVELDTILNRILYRRTCKSCGEIFNVKDKSIEKCNKCGGELYQRQDDNLETVTRRFKEYEEKTSPLVDYYKKQNKLLIVKGNDLPENVNDYILKIVNIIGS